MNYRRLFLDGHTIDARNVGDAGFDLKCYGNYTLAPLEIKSISTGIAVEIPEGWVGLLFSRSGLRFKFHVNVYGNGVIDSSYRGEIKILVENNSGRDFTFLDGDKVCQMILVPYYTKEAQEVTDLTSTSRGSNALGSTGGLSGGFI